MQRGLKIKKRILLSYILLMIGSLAVPIVSFAMYTPSPQSMTVVVINSPEDLEISIVSPPEPWWSEGYYESNSTWFDGIVSSRMWETYYHFFLCTEPAGRWRYEEIDMLIRSDRYGEFVMTFPVPQESGLRSRHFAIQLNLQDQSFTEGYPLVRTLIILLTWLIPFIGMGSLALFLFGYREKKSWQRLVKSNLIVYSFFMVNWFLLHMVFTSSLVWILFTLAAGLSLPGILIGKWIAESRIFKKHIEEHSKLRGRMCVAMMNLAGIGVVILLAKYFPLPAI